MARGLLDTLHAQDDEGRQLRGGLLNMGIGLLSGSTGHYGQFAPALAQGFAGFQQGQQQVIDDRFKKAQTEQMQALRNMQMQSMARTQSQEEEAQNVISSGIEPQVASRHSNPLVRKWGSQESDRQYQREKDSTTPLMRNLAAAGLQPGTPEYQAAMLQGTQSGTTVNVGQSEYGTIPPGYELFTDPQSGARSMRPIAGGPVDRQNKIDEGKAQTAKTNAANYAKTVTEDVRIALDELENQSSLLKSDTPIGGIAAQMSSNVPRTSAYNMKQFVDSALSNITLDTMNRMREGSPAGATGFGNMSDNQLRVIQGVLGQWSPGLPVEQQKLILHRIHDFYLDVHLGTRAEREQAVADGRMTQEEFDAIEEQYKATGRSERASQPNSFSNLWR